MKNLIVSLLVSVASMSSVALAGGGSTWNTETVYKIKGLSCKNTQGDVTQTNVKSVDLGESQTLTLSSLGYDHFYKSFKLSGDLNDCAEGIRFQLDEQGLLASRGLTFSFCESTQNALLSVFEKAEVSDLENGIVNVSTTLNGQAICGDANAEVIAVFGGK